MSTDIKIDLFCKLEPGTPTNKNNSRDPVMKQIHNLYIEKLYNANCEKKNMFGKKMCCRCKAESKMSAN